MRQAFGDLHVQTRGKGLTLITTPVLAWVRDQPVDDGLLTIWCCHTSASLLIQENADPDVRTDLTAYFERLAPRAAWAATCMAPKGRTTCRLICGPH